MHSSAEVLETPESLSEQPLSSQTTEAPQQQTPYVISGTLTLYFQESSS
ncbi:hypothetical protein [Chlamydia sp. 17-3921]|nr:hypothetical protein [Chlamydia sp. 17-3921]